MKHFIVLLLFTITGTVSAQSLPELIASYEKECSQMVADTIDQHGVVTYEHVPVLDRSGKILHYALGKSDTTWYDPDCPKSKEPPFKYLTVSNSGWISSVPIKSSPVLLKTEVPITRKFICLVRARDVEPFSEHFWNWVKTQK